MQSLRAHREPGPDGDETPRGPVWRVSRAVEHVLGRPPAYYRRKVRIYWTHWRRPIRWAGLAALAFVIGFSGAGLPLRSAFVETANKAALAAGLRVGAIVIEGDDGIPDLDVIEALAPFDKIPLPFFNVAEARERVMAIPRVRTATVQKLYPNTLLLTIEERVPFALWQRSGNVAVIDRDGRIVRQKPEPAQTGLPLFVGEGANVAARALEQALDDVPGVRVRVAAAIRVADRRWTLQLDNGVDVRLPETGPRRALGALATMMKQPRFFDQPIQSIDLRLADRVTLTLTDDGALARRTLIRNREEGVAERQT